MSIYHFIYKTSHNNGKYYIGRHSTNNINDGYLGSGRWVKSIKDKTTLSREIITFAENDDELKLLEEHHIGIHYDNPLCMNYNTKSVGFSSEETRIRAIEQIQNRTHNFITNHPVHNKIKDGSHHFLNNNPNTIKLTCPHCNKIVDKCNYNKWHGDKCKIITNTTIPNSIRQKQKISESMSKLKWYNNGIHSVRKTECPDGYIPGRIYPHNNN